MNVINREAPQDAAAYFSSAFAIDWEPQHAVRLAARDHIPLSMDHWEVIESVRAFYQEYEISPFLSMMVHYLCRTRHSKKWRDDYLKTLFPPDGISKACHYGGLPAPVRRSCP